MSLLHLRVLPYLRVLAPVVGVVAWLLLTAVALAGGGGGPTPPCLPEPIGC